MSSVGSLSSSTSTSIRGYGGLASGLDRDELIKGMTIGTTNKITQQEQKKQQLQWKQEAVQSISSSMIDFHSKYTETLTSPTNLFSAMLWGRNKITTSGANSKYVSVTGTASGADAITIMGVKQKAEDAKWTSSKAASTGSWSTGKIQINETYEQENLVGKSIELKYGNTSYSVYLTDSDDYNYKTKEGIADAINKLLEKQTTSDGKKLSEIIRAKGDDTTGSFSIERLDTNNNVEITGGDALKLLGLTNSEGEAKTFGKDVNVIESDGFSEIISNKTFSQFADEKTLTFSYNGESTTVKLDASKLDEYQKNATTTDKNDARVEAIAKSIQEQFDKAFGKGRIEVSSSEGEISFRTTIPGDEETLATDASSVLTLTGGSSALLGNKKGVLQSTTLDTNALHVGDTTRLNLNDHIEADALSKLRNIPLTDKDGNVLKDEKGNERRGFMLNDTLVEVGADATYNNLIKAINDSGANVTVTYQEAADKFTFTSKEKGASGVIDFSKNDAETLKALDNIFGLGFDTEKDKNGNNIVEIQIGNNKEELIEQTGKAGNKEYKNAAGEVKYYILSGKLYDNSTGTTVSGVDDINKAINYKKVTSVRGQDAIVSVKYAGSDEIVNLRRDSNSFTVDGLTIGVKGTFGDYNTDTGELQNIAVDQAVEVDASVDVDKVYDTIKAFVDSYNAIVDKVNTELTTKHEKDYDPLTSDQKSQLSDDEVEKWETKAKEGLLYGDSDLRSLSMDLRVVVSGGLLTEFEKIGITVSSTYSDNGKLSIDESKLRGALQTDPESVQKLFTSEAGVDADGKQTFNGLATNLKSVMNKYVNTMGSMESKGILIRKAGSKSSALSLTQNTYYNQMKSIDEALEKLKAKLKTEQDRYISQFSTLETLIANMNSQSSYLSSMSGY